MTPLIAHRVMWTACFSSRIQLKQKYTLLAAPRLSPRFPKRGHAQLRDSSHGHARSAGWSSSEITARLTDRCLVSGRSRVQTSFRPPPESYWLLWNSQGQFRMNTPRPVLPPPIFFPAGLLGVSEPVKGHTIFPMVRLTSQADYNSYDRVWEKPFSARYKLKMKKRLTVENTMQHCTGRCKRKRMMKLKTSVL